MLIEKNRAYEGVFYVGVKSTGIFCRPTCPAKKPKKENCEFFAQAKEALLASFRPCKRCRPLSAPSSLSPEVKTLVDAIEKNPEKKWTDKDLDALSFSANTTRRQFKKQFGMTFIEYARSRRMGMAFKHIRSGEAIIDAQLESGYDSSNGFRDAFAKIMGAVPTKSTGVKLLYSAWIDTRLGAMLAIADDEALLLLEFVDRRGLEKEIERLRNKLQAAIVPERTAIILQIEEELHAYFRGDKLSFSTPIRLLGTPFQQRVWRELQQIPVGTTLSYKGLAAKLEHPTAIRAAARANGANQLAIVVPCHRVIQTDGGLGGYAGGLPRKDWLLQHEKEAKLKRT
ncbi:bifunctional transcriptional activator/DNA repair protein Ada [Aureibacillus halotolerans]